MTTYADTDDLDIFAALAETPESKRDAGMAQTTNAADPRIILAIDAVIARYAASGMPFSANDIRDDLPVTHGPLIGARMRSAAMRKPTEIRKVGMTRSSLLSTHSAWIAVWQGVES